jgi:glucose dehydrogenase
MNSVEQRIGLNRRSFMTGLGGALGLWSLSAAGCSNPGPSVPEKPANRLGDIGERDTFDVCIIGSGFAGAILAESLGKAGIRTILLESGFQSSRPPSDQRLQPLEVFRSSGPISYPVARTRFRGVGGTSWLWGGFCSRLQPTDFEDNAFTPKGCSWPIKYSDIEPYYEQVEESFGARGDQETPYHPPRRKSYAHALNSDDESVRSMFAKVNVAAASQARTVPILRVAEAQVPRFQASGYGTLVDGATTTRLVTDGNRVVGAEVKDLDRNVKIIRALVFVVACGGLESPRLLLLSRGPGFPNGLGNNSDWVGRCFMEHRNRAFLGRAPVGLSKILFDRSFDVSYQFYREFKQQGLGGIHLNVGFDSLQGRDFRQWEVRRIMGKVWTPEVRIGAGIEMEPSPQNRVTLDPDLKDHFGNPVTNLFLTESELDKQTRAKAAELIARVYGSLKGTEVKEQVVSPWAHHHMGTCRMGDDPRASVVDRNLQVHGTSNLFVAGSSVFVTSGCAGPTVTLSALSLRLADHLRTQLRAGAFNGHSAFRHENVASVVHG